MKVVAPSTISSIRNAGFRSHAFSLVEVVLAVGILVFGILAILALLPVGLKQNQEAGEQIEAAGLMTSVLADLRNTAPGSSESRLYKISPLPLAIDGNRVVPNSALTIPAESTTFNANGSNVARVYLNRAGAVVTTPDANDFRVTIRYTRASGRGSAVSSASPENPASGIPTPVEAHVMISWPALFDPLVATERSNISSFVEVYTTFPF